MSKKKPLLRTEINTDVFKTSGDLPTPETVLKNVEQLTGQIQTEIVKLEMAEFKSYGRPKKVKALGREPFTTALHTDFIMMLKSRALKRGCTVADLIDTVFSDHLHKY